MAEDSVVVMKFWPVKTGNSVEGKTGMTRRRVRLELIWSKVMSVAKGWSLFESFQELGEPYKLDISRSTERGALSAVHRERDSADFGCSME